VNQPVTWGQIIAAYMPAAIIMVTILLGIMSNNRAIEGVHRRIYDTNHRIGEFRNDLRNEVRERFDDFRREFGERFDRIDQRLARLEERIEHPIVKGT
jgi:hypothetical protein